MKKTPLLKSNSFLNTLQTFLREEGWAVLTLALSFVVCFKDWFRFFSSRFFLSLDSAAQFYPLTLCYHDLLSKGKIPLISDLFENGAAIAATSMEGALSPFLWVCYSLFSGTVLYNFLFILPFALYLFGAYALGRELSLSPSACVLLALLWTYNGHQMAQLDHQHMAWAHAFFPWAFLCLLRFNVQRHPFWLMAASLFWGLCLFSGHPQVVFMEGLFFIFWALAYPQGTFISRWGSTAAMTLGTLLFTAPLTLLTFSIVSGSRWSDLDRFFHSWTPVNLITLLFPWFFGRDPYDGFNSDYWWQYQFVEMQVAFSIVGLFFILWFFFFKSPQRKWLAMVSVFAIAMALGKFFFLYPIVQSWPFFSFFRDPARYWFLATWAAGLGAAYAWDDWFKRVDPRGLRLSAGLALAALGIVIGGWFLLYDGRALVYSSASWFIQHCLLGDSLHTQSLSVYLGRLPEKLRAITDNLNPIRSRVWGPLLLLALLTLIIWNRTRWPLSLQKGLLLILVFADLMAFRMPLGNVFYFPQEIPIPALPPGSRTLPLIYRNNSPRPPQYGLYAFPDMNLVSQTAVLPLYSYPPMPRYETLLAQLGWFSWVYKDRNPLGFTRHPHLLAVLGVDHIVCDTSLILPKSFKILQNHLPYVYQTPGIMPKAWLTDQYRVSPWPTSIELLESRDFNPSHAVLLESNPGIPSNPRPYTLPLPQVVDWDETRLTINAPSPEPALLVLQKTFLPGWKAWVNGKPVDPLVGDLVLISVPLRAGENQIRLTFEPMSLRLGFFLALLFLAVFILVGACFILG